MLRGPGWQNWDMNLEKNTTWKERYHLQLRADSFNVFNHPNLSTPAATSRIKPRSEPSPHLLGLRATRHAHLRLARSSCSKKLPELYYDVSEGPFSRAGNQRWRTDPHQL